MFGVLIVFDPKQPRSAKRWSSARIRIKFGLSCALTRAQAGLPPKRCVVLFEPFGTRRLVLIRIQCIRSRIQLSAVLCATTS